MQMFKTPTHLLLATSLTFALAVNTELKAEQPTNADSSFIQSEPGETLDHFVQRTDTALEKFVAASGHEACAAIGTKGEQYALKIFTGDALNYQTQQDKQNQQGFTWSAPSECLNVDQANLASSGKDFSQFKAINAPNVGEVKYQFLFKEKSLAGESMDDFSFRISERLRSFSDETGYEACGVIAKNGTNYSVVIGTNEAHAMCLNSSFFIDDGYESVGMTIHSHPRSSTYIVNKQDQVILGKLERVGTRYDTGDQKRLFSKEDYASGPGYLVSPFGDVYKQEGSAKTVQKIEKKSYLAQSL
ncbi:hypothetical protein [Pseudoxanthomonas winnipegensis]|uniref:Uncharacterized protein n=1 Tax=Pseudoxanthomonas winnipegensis TaxID=2480810 RepID=A0A4Q8M4X0_9GAMM|nr:hypothetical protein [Pseudoxanthomonas winnipegensis]TAA41534.1 hypothetical protein EA655_11370 [Pseudoxanthomonas winnipegensis]